MEIKANGETAGSPINRLNEDDIELYFEFLSGGTPEIHTTYFLDLESDKPVQGLGCYFGKCEDILKLCRGLTGRGIGYTLHSVLNRTNLKGRRTKDIEGSRVLAFDLDRVTPVEDLKAIVERDKPGLVVESSPGKYHLYWKLETGGMPLAVWSQIQLAINFECGDLGLAQTTHGLRVPGVIRALKGTLEPYMPRIVLYDPSQAPLNFKTVCDKWPNWQAKFEAASAQLKVKRKGAVKAGKQAVKGKGVDSAELALVGERNDFLYTAVKTAVSQDTELTIEDVHGLAQEINSSFKSPLEESEVLGICRKVWDKRVMPAQPQPQPQPRPIEPVHHVNGHLNGAIAPSNPNQPAALPTDGDLRYCDEGVVTEVIERFKERLMWFQGAVYACDTTHSVWSPQSANSPVIATFIREVVSAFMAEPQFITSMCTNAEGQVTDKAIRKAKHRMVSNGMQNACAELLLSHSAIKQVEAHEFREPPGSYMCANGLVDLLTGEIREALPKDMLLRRSGIRWKGLDAKCDRWISFLGEVFAANETPNEMIGFLQRVFGYSLSGSVEMQKIFIHFGEGSNGKSKVLDALDLILGDYSTRMDGASLAKKKTAMQKEIERIGAQAEGKRVTIIDDLDTATQWNEGIVKMLTGTKIIARKLYAEKRDIINTCKFHIGCNQAPEPEAENLGILRRLCIIPYRRTFEPSGAADRAITSFIEEELSGILAWAVRGYQQLVVEHGFRLMLPEEVEDSIQEYKAEHFTLERQLRRHFRKPVKPEDGRWFSVEEVIAVMKGSTIQVDPNLTPIKIGIAIGKTFDPEIKRPKMDGIKVRFYLLEQINPGADLKALL